MPPIKKCDNGFARFATSQRLSTGISAIHHVFPHTDETADGEYACAREELYGVLREREADPIHVFAATPEDMAALEFGPCPHGGAIAAGERMTRFEFPERGLVYFHIECVPPTLRPGDDPA